MQNIIIDLKNKNPDLKEAEIESILYLISSNDSLTNNDLVSLTGLPKIVIQKFKTSITPYLMNSKNDLINIHDEYKEIFLKYKSFEYKWRLYEPILSDTDQDVVQVLKKLRQEYNLSAKRTYDQFYALAESSVKKAKLAENKGMIKNNRIALIGDDDFVSITLGLLNPNYLNIDVFEIDDDLIDYIKKSVAKLSLKNINVYKYDARENISKNFINKYDLVLIDPPYTRYGAELFLYRSLELLKRSRDSSGHYIFLNFGVGLKNIEKEIKIQEIISRFNLLIEDKLNKFTLYSGAETIGNTSSMYVLKNIGMAIPTNFCVNTKIYTFENDPEERFPYVDHLVIKVKKVPDSVVYSKSALLNIFGKFSRLHKLKIVDTKITKFKNKGLSLTFILASSNLIIHTWPELSSIHIDLITCAPIVDKDEIAGNLSDLLGTEVVEVRNIE